MLADTLEDQGLALATRLITSQQRRDIAQGFGGGEVVALGLGLAENVGGELGYGLAGFRGAFPPWSVLFYSSILWIINIYSVPEESR